jgi:hypothetical protein
LRTTVAGSGKGSDLINLMIIGDKEALGRAFQAAGWVRADTLSAWTGFQTVRAFTEQTTYREAPMSTLLLDGHAPDYQWSKAWNNFAERHHLRIWQQDATWDGQQLWLSSSTHDVAVAVSRRNRSFIHVIDEHIDDERSKVVNDLTFTGCVDAVQVVPRPWAPADATNGTGQKLETDGAVVVVKLNGCSPESIQNPFPHWTPAPRRSLPARIASQFLLTTRNDLVRDNIVVTAVGGIRSLRKKSSPHATGLHQLVLEDGTFVEQPGEKDSSMIPVKRTEQAAQTGQPEPQPQREVRRAYVPPHMELSISAGVPHIPQARFSNQPLIYTSSGSTESFSFDNRLDGRWTIATRGTLNSGDRWSHEFGYEYNRVALTFIVHEDRSLSFSEPAEIRRFNYNLLFHFRKRSSRIRPYIDAGPVLQLMNVKDSVMHQESYYKFGLKTLGLFATAWDFGSKAPLEGGGIFQPAVQYGTGVKWYLSSRFLVRADYRETLSRAPDFWTKSYASLTSWNTPDESLVPGKLTLYGPLRQQNITIGFAIGF